MTDEHLQDLRTQSADYFRNTSGEWKHNRQPAGSSRKSGGRGRRRNMNRWLRAQAGWRRDRDGFGA